MQPQPPQLPKLPANPYQPAPDQPVGPPAPTPTTSYDYPAPKRRILLPAIIILLVIAVIALISWIAFQQFASPPRQSLTADKTTYNFVFGKNAKKVEKGGFTSLQGQELHGNTLLGMTIKKSPVEGDCKSRGATAAFTVQIEDGTFPVCRTDQVFVTYFKKGAQWHIVTIFPQDGKSQLNQDGVKEILHSIKVQ